MSNPFVFNLLKNNFLICSGIAIASFGALGFAFFMQYERGLDPCHLCLLQRWPYGLTGLLGLMGLACAGAGRRRLCAAIVSICALIFLGEAGLAFYHVGVEQHWWVSVFESCMITFPKGGNLLAQIEARPPARCDEIAWTLLGLSMAAWNMVWALVLCACSATASGVLWRTLRREPAA